MTRDLRDGLIGITFPSEIRDPVLKERSPLVFAFNFGNGPGRRVDYPKKHSALCRARVGRSSGFAFFGRCDSSHIKLVNFFQSLAMETADDWRCAIVGACGFREN